MSNSKSTSANYTHRMSFSNGVVKEYRGSEVRTVSSHVYELNQTQKNPSGLGGRGKKSGS